MPTKLKQLTKLKLLYCDGNNFETFPVVISQLPNLQELRISSKTLKGLPDEVLELQHIRKLILIGKNSKQTPYIYVFERLLKNIKIYGFSRQFQLLFLRIIRGSLTVADLNNEQLFSLLDGGIPAYSNQALTELEKRIQNHQFGPFRWPKAGDKIIIKGKIKGKVSELKQRLLQNEIHTGIKINQATTHILVGSMPNDIFATLQQHQAVLITEQLLVTHLNQLEQPYLLASPQESNLESIRQLLESKQTENILLALEMLKGGGFPLQLLTELFLVYKFSNEQKIKRIIIQIVGQYAPLDFVTALKSRKSIRHSVSGITLRRNLEYYCNIGDLDKRRIAFYLLEKGTHKHLFALFNLSTADKKEYFAQALQDGYLSLSGLELSELPDDIGKISNLTHLDISYNNFTAIPTQLFKCKQLKIIEIKGLYEIHKNHEDLWKIPSLSTIYVGYNNQWEGCPSYNSLVINGKKIVGR